MIDGIYIRVISKMFRKLFKRIRSKKPPEEKSDKVTKFQKAKRSRRLPKDDKVILDKDDSHSVIHTAIVQKDYSKKYVNLQYKCHGYFAKIYKAKDNTNNSCVGIKRIRVADPFFYKVAKKEALITSCIRSNNVIKLKESFVIGEYMYLVYPYYKTDLFGVIPDFLGRPKKIMRLLLNVACGIRDIHKMEFIHGDIKPENILMDGCKPIIIDLGLARSANVITLDDTLYKKLSGTLAYLPPEVITRYFYTKKMDIWAFGILMYVMLFYREPFYDSDDKEMFNQIKYREQYYPVTWQVGETEIPCKRNVYTAIVDLNKWLLMKESESRPFIDNVITRLQKIIDLMDCNQSKKCMELSHKLEIEHIKRFKTA